jgi:hypothetical protein
MVRAAASGAFDYRHADPTNRQWQLRHLLVLKEIARQQDEKILTAAHAQWLAYVGHSNLEPESWTKIKQQAADTLDQLRQTIFPWTKREENKQPTDTIDNKYGDLIAQYRAMVASKESPDNPPAAPET